jgi:deferrochelatase/peroxidase EfeB
MNGSGGPRSPGQRKFFAASSGTAIAATVGAAPAGATVAPAAESVRDIEPFRGLHQAGIATALQSHIYFAAFDLVSSSREEVVALLKTWTDVAERMSKGQLAPPLDEKARSNKENAGTAVNGADGYEKPPSDAPELDSGEAFHSPPARLTVTFGFGSGLFMKDGVDRYGLAQRRPEALIELPRFNGDQLVPERTGGDLCVMACADDPQIAFHAVRQLARFATPAAKMRWAQTGFTQRPRNKETPRNLMGFKDGTVNVPVNDHSMMDQFVWVGNEGAWMKHGSYVVVRPIRIALEHWDRMNVGFQERVVGRHKQSGAPLGRVRETDGLDLDANDADGNPRIPENAHTRLAAPASNDGAQILRRPYSYDNGLSFTAERWPPWRQGMEFDAGLLFVCYQRDPRTGFVKIYDKMSKFDMMNQFATHIGGGLFACPPGALEGRFIGQTLFGIA